MDERFVQAHKEARWAFALTLAYLVGWILSAYWPDDSTGITGLPFWFEIACIYLPLLFIVFCWLMVRFVFRDIPLGDNDAN